MMVEAPLVVRREAQEVAAHCDRDDGKSSVKLARIRRPLTALKHRSVPSDQRNFDSCLLVGIPAFPAALYRASRFLRCSLFEGCCADSVRHPDARARRRRQAICRCFNKDSKCTQLHSNSVR